MAESKGAIATAVAANLAIAVAKFTGAALTGSSAMLAEGVHSVVDTLNQGLLLVGLKRAERPADAKHPFGYGRELYFYSFVVALLIFLAGGLYSLYEGVERIRHPEAESGAVIFGLHLSALAVNLAILGFAILAEGYSLYVAYSSMPKGGTPFAAIRRSKDPSLFVVLAEDSAAVGGLVLALLGVVLSNALGMPVLDGVASVAIGLLLVGMAFFLMVETHGLLIGEAADPEIVEGLRAMVRAEPRIRHLNEVLTQHLGPRDILVNVSLDIVDGVLSEEIEAITAALTEGLRKTEAVRRVFIEIQSEASSDGFLKRRVG